MTENQKKLLRSVYQTIPTPEERDLYLAMINKTPQEKAAYIMGMTRQLGLTPQQVDAFMAITYISKEDRAALAGQVARGLIMRFLAWLGVFK